MVVVVHRQDLRDGHRAADGVRDALSFARHPRDSKVSVRPARPLEVTGGQIGLEHEVAEHERCRHLRARNSVHVVELAETC